MEQTLSPRYGTGSCGPAEPPHYDYPFSHSDERNCTTGEIRLAQHYSVIAVGSAKVPPRPLLHGVGPEKNVYSSRLLCRATSRPPFFPRWPGALSSVGRPQASDIPRAPQTAIITCPRPTWTFFFGTKKIVALPATSRAVCYVTIP